MPFTSYEVAAYRRRKPHRKSEDQVVHVAQVVPAAHLARHELVQLAQVHVRPELARQVPDRQPPFVALPEEATYAFESWPRGRGDGGGARTVA